MATNPLVSIIIPVYNTEESYLCDCLSPFIKHREPRIEIIIVDDGSRTETNTVLHKLTEKSPNTIHIIRRDNGGQNAARNTGIEMAAGEYIEFLDSDDYIDWDSQLKVLDAIEQEKPDILGINVIRVTSNGTAIGRWELTDNGLPLHYIDKAVLLCNCSALWQQLIRRDLFSKSSARLSQGIYIGEDLASIAPLIMLVDRVATMGVPLYYCRMRSTSITHEIKPERLMDIVKAFQSILTWMQNNDAMAYRPYIEYLAIKHIQFAGVARAVEWEGPSAPSAPLLIMEMNNMFPNWRKNQIFQNDARMRKINYRLVLSGHYALYDFLRRAKHHKQKLFSKTKTVITSRLSKPSSTLDD